MMDFSHLPRATAFVLDDNKMVIIEFQKHFKEISVLDCRTYTSPTMFLKDAQIGKPEIVILDYYIDKDLTAEQIINDLGYSPEVFIMSQDKDIQVRIKEKGYDFFYKDDHYVSKIARAVVQYLIDKN
jgi:FixJ family two-component response regulator